MKLGDGAKRDSIGRLYTYFQIDELTALLTEAGFKIDEQLTTTGTSVGLDGCTAGWIKMFART